MGLDDAGAVIRWRDEDDPVIRTTVVDDSLLLDRCSHAEEDAVAIRSADGSTIVCTRIKTGNLSGHLMVESVQNRLDDPETRSFLSTVGHQLAVRVENALLAKQEQEMWSAYVKLVTQAQEDERRRVARDLHDGPAQNLAMLVRTLDGEAEDSALAGELRSSAASILDDLRRVARDQRPTLLDDLGVAAALEWLVADAARASELTLTLSVEGDPNRLDAETELALYRIAQEAIRNAERHADASLVDVRLHFDSDEVRLSVEDDGTGFTVPDSPGGHVQAGRLGLMGMHERAQLVGGSLDVESAPDRGATVSARLRQS